MPTLFEQQEARRKERRAQEREQERHEKKLETLREQARDEQREREREEQARLEALQQSRAYAADEERRRQRHLRTVERRRQERRARARAEERQLGRSATAREAALTVRLALSMAEAAEDERRAVRRDQARQAARQESHLERNRAMRRDARREEARQADQADQRYAARREEAREARRDGASAGQRAEERRQSREQARRDEQRARERAAATREDRRRGNREAVRRSAGGQPRAESRRAVRSTERRDRQRLADRAASRAMARRGQARAERRTQSRDENRARRQTESARTEQLDARRESARVELRAQERARSREQQRAQERAAALRRDLAARHRTERISAGRAAPTALRVLGPLLLDAHDQPVRLRGVELPPLTVTPLDLRVEPPVQEAQLDELVRWGATALSIPVGLDDLLSPPAAPVDPRLLPEGAVEVVETQPPADARVLSALESHLSLASPRGIVTVLQLGPLRSPSDDRPVDMDALRLFWRRLAQHFGDEPSVVFRVLPGSDVGLHPAQFRIVTLALVGEIRSVSPGAVVVVESHDGGIPQAAPGLHGILYGVRVPGDLPAETLAAVAARARTAPVMVVGWGDGLGMPPQDAVGRRLASVGAHWLAAGWPQPPSLDVPGRLRATSAGSSVASGLGNPDRPIGTTRTDGTPTDAGRPRTLGVGGGGGPGMLGLPGLVAQLLVAAVPGPQGADASLAPPLPASRYLPSEVTVLTLVKQVDRAVRAAVIGDIRDGVLVRWNACQAAGLITVLKRVRSVEQAAWTALPPVPTSLPRVEPTRIVPKFLRERLMLDGRAKIGADLVTGVMTLDDAAATPASTTSAVLSLRQLDDVLSRALSVERAAVATGAERALVLALYRAEGGLGMPPSADSILSRIPSGTTNEESSLERGVDISQLVWVSNTTAVTTVGDANGLALASFLLQIAGLDILSGKSWAQYTKWTQDTWALGSGSVPDPAGAAARTALLQGAITVGKRNLAGVAGSDVFIAAVRDPVALTANALGDGVQLLRANRSVASLFAVAHLPAGAPIQLSEGMAYLRYNAGDEQTRSLLASAALAAAGTKRPRWAGLRSRIDAPLLSNLASATAAGLAATSGLKDRRQVAKLRSEAVWPAMEPWLEQPGNLVALEEFVNQADGDEWATGWFEIRANVARFRVLLAFYRKLFATPH